MLIVRGIVRKAARETEASYGSGMNASIANTLVRERGVGSGPWGNSASSRMGGSGLRRVEVRRCGEGRGVRGTDGEIRNGERGRIGGSPA